jgi:hypothetical protein
MRVPSESRPILRGWPFFLTEALTDRLQTPVQDHRALSRLLIALLLAPIKAEEAPKLLIPQHADDHQAIAWAR